MNAYDMEVEVLLGLSEQRIKFLIENFIKNKLSDINNFVQVRDKLLKELIPLQEKAKKLEEGVKNIERNILKYQESLKTTHRYRRKIFEEIRKRDVFVPDSETSLIIFFLQTHPEYTIKKFSSHSFPDAILLNEGKEISVEFEYIAYSFNRHKPQLAKAKENNKYHCDLCICWHHRSGDRLPVPCWALSTDEIFPAVNINEEE